VNTNSKEVNAKGECCKNDGLLDYYTVQQNVCSGVSEALSLSLSILKVIKCGSGGFNLSNLPGLIGTEDEDITFVRNAGICLPVCTV